MLSVLWRDMSAQEKWKIVWGIILAILIIFFVGTLGGRHDFETIVLPDYLATTEPPPADVIAALEWEYRDTARMLHVDPLVGMRTWHNGESVFIGSYHKGAFTYDSDSNRLTLRYTHGWACNGTQWSGTLFASCGQTAKIRRFDNTTSACHINVWLDLPELCPKTEPKPLVGTPAQIVLTSDDYTIELFYSDTLEN